MPTTIEWADETWGPTLGCMKVSAGCENCYAIRTAYRQEYGFKRPQYSGLTRRLPDGSVNWTGTVRTLPERLALPLSWRQPRRIFVDSMSDLFHEDVPDAFIDQAFAVMTMTPWHTYQVLTKRPGRLLDYMSKLVQGVWAGRMFRDGLPDTDVHRRVRDAMVETFPKCSADVLNRASDWQDEHHPGGNGFMREWPLPNVWLGVSVEDQRSADERIPLLLQTPAAVRFLSCEPLLGPVDLSRWLDNISDLPPLTGTEWLQPPQTPTGWYQINEFEQPLHWIIAGGESGPGYRPMNPDWARVLRDQSVAAGIPFHFKQHGGRTHAAGGRELDGREWNQYPDASRDD